VEEGLSCTGADDGAGAACRLNSKATNCAVLAADGAPAGGCAYSSQDTDTGDEATIAVSPAEPAAAQCSARGDGVDGSTVVAGVETTFTVRSGALRAGVSAPSHTHTRPCEAARRPESSAGAAHRACGLMPCAATQVDVRDRFLNAITDASVEVEFMPKMAW
jgi:hypothetical protein